MGPVRTRPIQWVLGLVLVCLVGIDGLKSPSAPTSTTDPGLDDQRISLAGSEEQTIEAFSITTLTDRSNTRFQHRKPGIFQDPNKTIEVGLHVENVHQLSRKDKNHWVEGWYWLRWPRAIQTILEAEKIPTARMVEFVA